MAETTIIGRLAVRIYPDTRKFPEDLRQKLNRIEEDTNPIGVNAELDIDGLKEELRAALRSLSQQAANGVQVGVDLSDAGVARQAKRLKQDLETALGDIEVNVKAKSADNAAQQLGDFDLDREFERAGEHLDDLFDNLQRTSREVLDLKSEMRETMREINRLAPRRAQVEIDLDLDTDALVAEIDAVAEHRSIDMDVQLLGMNKAQRQVYRMQRELGKLGERLRLDVQLKNLSQEQRERILLQMADLRDDIQKKMHDIEVELAPQVDELFYRRAQQRLAWLARARFVTLVPRVDPKAAAGVAATIAALSGARVVGDSLRKLRDLFKNLDKNIPIIGSAAEAVAGLAGWALSASANLFALSSSLAAIGGAALALPGIFGAMAIGLTVSLVAFSQMSKVVPDVTKSWGRLKGVISDNFWDQAAKPLREMTRRLLPEFEIGMARAATNIGAFFGQFGRDLGKHLTDGPMLQMFEDLGDSVSIARSATDGLARSITILGKQGAAQLPRLADFFVTVTNRFAGWLEEADRSGALLRFIDNGVQAMKDLGAVTYETGRLLAGLARAAEAGGGSTLKTLGDTLRDAADAINTPAFQTQLIATLKASNDMMERIANISGPAVKEMFRSLGALLEVILPKVGNTIGELMASVATALADPFLQAGLVDLFDALEASMHPLAVAIEALAPALGAIFSLIATGARTFIPILVVALTALGEMVEALAPTFEVLVVTLGEAFGSVVQGLAPVFVELAHALGPVLEMLGGALAVAIRSLGPALVEVFRALGEVARIAAPYLAEIAIALGQGIAEALKAIAPHLPEIASKLFPQLLEVVKAIIPKIPALVDGFLGLVDAIVGTTLISDLGNLAGVLLQLVSDGTMTTLATTMGEMARALGIIVSLVGFVLGPLRELPIIGTLITTAFQSPLGLFIQQLQDLANTPFATALFDAGKALIDGLVAGLTWAADKVKTFFTWLTEKIVEWKPKAKDDTLLKPAGIALISGLIAGLIVKVDDIRTALTTITTAITNKFATAGTWLLTKGTALVTGLRTGISESAGRVRTAAGDLLSKAKDGVLNAGTTLWNAGYRIVTGFIDGIKYSFQRVRDVLRDLTALLPSWKGPASTDSKILFNAGQLVMGGLVDGLKDGFDDVRDFLGDVTGEIAGTHFVAGDVTFGAASADLQRRVGKGLTGGDAAPAADLPDGVRTVVYQTNHNPIAQNTSEATNDGLQIATVMEI